MARVMYNITSHKDKQRMLEMLKRLEEHSSDDGGGGVDVNPEPTQSLEERLAGLDLGR